MAFSAYFFDLDGTLYPETSGLMDQIRDRIDQWIVKTMNISPSEASAFREKMYKKYGATLPGLALECGSDYFASMRYCHELDLGRFVQGAPQLREPLLALPGMKYIFTNSYRIYAARVLKCLGLLDCFDGMIDAVDIYPTPKPAEQAFLRALEITAESEPSSCVFFDDAPRNILAAKKLGFYTVQVGTVYPRSEAADEYLERIEEISELSCLYGSSQH